MTLSMYMGIAIIEFYFLNYLFSIMPLIIFKKKFSDFNISKGWMFFNGWMFFPVTNNILIFKIAKMPTAVPNIIYYSFLVSLFAWSLGLLMLIVYQIFYMVAWYRISMNITHNKSISRAVAMTKIIPFDLGIIASLCFELTTNDNSINAKAKQKNL